MSRLCAGAVVPHAPLLLQELTSDEVAPSAQRIRVCVDALPLAAPALVIVSPHAGSDVVYRRPAGNLDGFGVRGIAVAAAGDEGLGERVADACGLPVSDEPCDHGIVVPLRLLDVSAEVVAIGLDGAAELDRCVELGALVAAAIRTISQKRDVDVVASVNGSAGLSARAPLTEVPGALDAEARLLKALDSDASALADVLQDHVAAGGCSAPVLAAFAEMFAGRRMQLLAHEAPVGVGYPVALAPP